MKLNIYIIAIFLICIQNSSLSQVTSVSELYYEDGDSLTVIALNGVNLRDSFSTNSPKLISIPFGQKIIVEGWYFNTTVIQDRYGGWIKAKYKDQVGYIFSGFVTNLKIPKLDTTKINCDYQTWFEDLFRDNTDSLVYKGERGYNSFDKDKSSGTIWEVFKDETIIHHFIGYECGILILESPEINMNEILNLLEYYLALIKNRCPSKAESSDASKPEINIKKYGERIQKIECAKIGFIAEKVKHKIIVEMTLWAI